LQKVAVVDIEGKKTSDANNHVIMYDFFAFCRIFSQKKDIQVTGQK